MIRLGKRDSRQALKEGTPSSDKKRAVLTPGPGGMGDVSVVCGFTLRVKIEISNETERACTCRGSTQARSAL